MKVYKFDPKDDVETQWKKWSESDIEFDDVSDEELKENIVKDLSYVSQMDVREYTLYQKYCEVKQRYPTITVNDLWEGERQVLKDEKQRKALAEVKNNIWQPFRLATKIFFNFFKFSKSAPKLFLSIIILYTPYLY